MHLGHSCLLGLDRKAPPAATGQGHAAVSRKLGWHSPGISQVANSGKTGSGEDLRRFREEMSYCVAIKSEVDDFFDKYKRRFE
jgi:hypothetical protein